MSKRSERREVERTARKLAYQQSRQQPPAAVQVIAPAPIETDLLTRAQAFFQTKEISEAQLAANRANAQLSTGPVTAEGKSISSRNNIRHGLTAEAEGDNFKVLPSENQAAYDQSLADFRQEWKPATATEHDLVNRLILHQWLRNRAVRLQESLFDPQTGDLTDTKKFDLFRRYETQHERGFNKAFADLMRLRSFQLRQQNGFESQRRKNEEHAFKMRRLQAQEAQLKAKQVASNPPNTASTSSQIPLPQAAYPSQPPAGPAETVHA